MPLLRSPVLSARLAASVLEATTGPVVYVALERTFPEGPVRVQYGRRAQKHTVEARKLE